MSDILHKALQEYWKVYRTDPKGYFIVGKNSQQHINQNYINNLFKKFTNNSHVYTKEKIKGVFIL